MANTAASESSEVSLPASGRFSFVRGLSFSDYLTLANGMGGAGAILAVLAYMSDGNFAWLALRCGCGERIWHHPLLRFQCRGEGLVR